MSSTATGASPRLAIFDVDGTLTQTSEVDDECFRRAVREEWGVESMSTDWSEYPHSTDFAIAAEIHRRRFGREATSDVLDAVRARFAALVREEADRRPQRFQPVAGARELLPRLVSAGWRAAIATGGWTPSARCKLDRAGIPPESLPAAFACDARPREAIIRIAAHRACLEYRVERFERVVYVGDGIWDARACRSMGIPFVGIAEGERALRLRREGATIVLGDYRDAVAVLEALERASAPVG